MANYLYGTEWGGEPFYMVPLDETEKNNMSNTTNSEEWITSYKIHSNATKGKLNFTLNIIDTPGIESNKGDIKDDERAKRIKDLFLKGWEIGINRIDAVCFIFPAFQAFLTTSQIDICKSMIGVFQGDARENIFTIITYYDGGHPIVLKSLEEVDLGIPCKEWFAFNNGCLFHKKNTNDTNSLLPELWNENIANFKKFCDALKRLERKQLHLDDLRKRKSNEESLSNMLQNAQEEYQGTKFILCRDSRNASIILGYDPSLSLSKIEIPPRYNGSLLIKNPRNVSDEAFKALKFASEMQLELNAEQQDIIHTCISKHSSNLWKSHSNLTMISGDCVKCTDGHPKAKLCIVLYCLSKGLIPLKEGFFPSSLQHEGREIEVDVREGYFVFGPTIGLGSLNGWNDPVKMGSDIGNENDGKTGSIGFFVNLPNNEIGFVTCCHVLFDCIHSSSFDHRHDANKTTHRTLQPSLGSFCGRDKEERICGFVEKAIFKPDVSPVSVDAALVKMTKRKPTSGYFSISQDSQITEAGFDEKQPPSYKGGKVFRNIPKSEREKPLIKSGAKTGLTKGVFKLHGLEVSVQDDGVYLGDSMKYFPKRAMKGQYELLNCKKDYFFDLGDSGSGVFLKDPDGSLTCIGMAIGKTSFNTTVVTPIGAILDALNLRDEDVINFEEPMDVDN